MSFQSLLVQRLSVGGSARNVAVTSRLVGTSGKLELVRGLEVSIAGSAVGSGVITEVEKELEHSAIQRKCEELVS